MNSLSKIALLATLFTLPVAGFAMDAGDSAGYEKAGKAVKEAIENNPIAAGLTVATVAVFTGVWCYLRSGKAAPLILNDQAFEQAEDQAVEETPDQGTHENKTSVKPLPKTPTKKQVKKVSAKKQVKKAPGKTEDKNANTNTVNNNNVGDASKVAKAGLTTKQLNILAGKVAEGEFAFNTFAKSKYNLTLADYQAFVEAQKK